MRYTIYLKNKDTKVTFYDTASPTQELSLIDPRLHMEVNSAGNFETSFPPNNLAIKRKIDNQNLLIRLASHVYIKRDSDTIWSGRLLSLDEDFNKQLHGYFEGAYTYLNDTIQTQKDFKNFITFTSIIEYLINWHNKRANAQKTFLVGNIKMDNDILKTNPFSIDYCTTLEAFESLRSQYGGNMRVRYESGWIVYPFISAPCYFMPFKEFPKPGSPELSIGSMYCDITTGIVYWYANISETEYGYIVANNYKVYDKSEFPVIDWFPQYDNSEESLSNAQTIDFGVNLIDFTKKQDASSLSNIIIPIGKVVNSGGNTVIAKEIPIISDINDFLGPDKNTLSYGNGWRIIKTEDTYIYEEEESNNCTGFWDSGIAKDLYPDITPPDHALKVYPGEVYYLSCLGTASTTMYVITEGKMGYNGTQVRDARNANSSWDETTTFSYLKVTVPDSLYGGQLYMNMSALKACGTAAPTKITDLNMSIYSSRKIPENLDERITLKGLGDGSFDSYLDSDNILITPKAIEPGWFIYPDTGHPAKYMEKSDFPDNESAEGAMWYCDTNTGDIFECIYVLPSKRDWISITTHRAYYYDGHGIIDKKSVAENGPIEKILTFDSIIDPESLKKLAAMYLFVGDFDELNIDVSALDLSILESNVDSPDILDPVRIHSEPHGIDIVLPIQERDIPFNDLSSQTFSIGYEKSQKITSFNEKIIN